MSVNRVLGTNDSDELIYTLEYINSHLEKVESSTYHWKWILLAWHSVIQNVMIHAIDNGDCFRVFLASGNKRIKEIYWETHENNYDRINKLQLPKFMELYDGIKNNKLVTHPFPENVDCDRNVRLLNKLRNEFTHYQPHAWVLDVCGCPRLLLTTAGIIDFYMLNGLHRRWFDEDDEGLFLHQFGIFKNHLVSLQNYYK